MNINTSGLLVDEPDLALGDTPSETLADQLQEHQHIMGRSGKWTLTGEVALIPPPEPELAALGTLQVWCKTADGMWVHITPDGVAVEAGCPLGD